MTLRAKPGRGLVNPVGSEAPNLWRGLRLLYSHGEGGFADANLVRGNEPLVYAATTATPSRVVGPFGRSALCDNSDDYASATGLTTWTATNQWTIAGVFDGFANAIGGGVVFSVQSAGANRIELGADQPGTGWRIHVRDGAAAESFLAGGTQSTAPQVLVAKLNGTALELWANGVQVATASHTWTDFTAARCFFGARGAGDRHAGIRGALSLFANRVWSDAEIRQFSQDPFALIRARRAHPVAVIGGGGGGGFQAAWASRSNVLLMSGRAA